MASFLPLKFENEVRDGEMEYRYVRYGVDLNV